MDNHLGNNERFSILPGHKSSRHSPHRQVPGRAHLVVAGNKEKQRKASSLETRTGNFSKSVTLWTPLHASIEQNQGTLSINYEHIDGAGAKIISLCFPW